MAEQLLRDELAKDADGDGYSDLLQKVLGSKAFSGQDNWKNRRVLIMAFIIMMMFVAFAISVTTVIAALGRIPLDNNTADLLSAVFWGACLNASGALSAYMGVASWEHASQRRATTDAVERIGSRAHNTPQTPPWPPAYQPPSDPYNAPQSGPYGASPYAPASPYDPYGGAQRELPFGPQPGSPQADPPGGY